MEKEFVNYEQSLALKELGFDEPCFGGYLKDTGELWIGYVKSQGGEQFNRDYHIPAPIFSQVFRWFRENYELICNIDIYSYSHTETNFEFDITNKKMTVSEYSNTNKSYEEAELECLKKLIKIIKNK